MVLQDSDLIAEFAIESLEGLAGIEQQLLAIESAGAAVDIDQVNAVFRTMHSIKGTAGFFGLDRIAGLAHRLEEVLNHMRTREIVPSADLVTTLLSASDFMRQLITAVDSSNESDISDHVAALEGFLPGAKVARTATVPTSTASVEASTDPTNSTEVSTVPLSDAVREFIVESYENLEQMERDLMALEADPAAITLVRGIFRTMHSIKGGAGFLALPRLEKLAHSAETVLGRWRDGALAPTRQAIDTMLKTVDKCREGLRSLEENGNDAALDVAALLPLLERCADNASQTVSAAVAVAAPSVAPPAPKNAAPQSATPAAETSSPARKPVAESERPVSTIGDATIRVDVELLDKLMMQVGELVLARNQIVQNLAKLPDAGLAGTAQRLNLITSELQESLMKTRMQPIGNVWSKFPRVVRDLSSQLHKQVRIEMEGKETELDRTIVEAIKDPLTHLVRNSIDHGIESPDARMSLGKPAEGCLLLRAYHEGGQVNIEIVDDGAGLNLDRIRKKAVERGMMSDEKAARLSDRDASLLIFAPGFSTAEQITSVSGRGVGMDVVRTNIEKIGGTIDLQSRPGRGTTIKIKIPLTLAIIPALIVTNDGDRYAIPQVSLLELVRLECDDAQRQIEYVHGSPVYRLRGKLLPLVYLSERFGADRETIAARYAADEQAAVNIVVLRADDRQFGLVVDKVNDTEEIVVKPLGKQLKGIIEYAGATIMGDGDVALILDVKGLAVAAGLGAELRERLPNHEAEPSTTKAGPCQAVLVVDIGDDRRFALPTSMVARLEKIPASNVERTNGREVIQYRGAILPLVHLADVFGGPNSSTVRGELQVIVYDEHERSFGLVVERIVDITEAELNFPADRIAGEHLLGTTVVQQRVTDVLDLRSLTGFKRGTGARAVGN